MATHYIENENSGNQYYFDANINANSQVQRPIQDRTYVSPAGMTTQMSSSEFSSHPVSISGAHVQHQQNRSDRNTYIADDPYQLPQQHQSIAGFNKTQQQYQSVSAPSPQVKATVRSVHNQEPQQQQHVSSVQYQPSTQQRQHSTYTTYEQQGPQQVQQVSHHHHQYEQDSRQQLGQTPNVSDHYQISNSASYTQHELNQRTESPSQGRDQRVQVQQVSARPIASSSHEQHDTSVSHQQQSQQYSTSQASPQQQKHDDQLQQYYSQLTPEQYQQLLRHQQIQRQQQEEQKRQQLAQEQYYLQQQQERKRTDQLQQQQQQQQQYHTSRSNQESQQYDEQRRVYQSSPNQQQQYRQQGHDQYDEYHNRPQQVQSIVSPQINQDAYRQQQQQHYDQQSQLDTYYEQQRRTAAHQPSSSSPYQQEPNHPITGIADGHQYQQISINQHQHHVGTDLERQRQDEQEYYASQLARQQQQEREYAAQIEAAQHQQAAQRVQQQQYQEQQQTQQSTQPVGIRGLMNKFAGPTKIPTYEPKPKTTTTRQYSSSSYTSSTGPGQTTTVSRTSQIHTMTYSALPKPQEPPVNSVEYYQMIQEKNTGNTSSSVQQSATPPHIQGPAPGFDALRDRFKTGSVTDGTNPIHDDGRQHQTNISHSSLSSLRDQYMNRAKESIQSQEETFSQRIQNVSRSIVVDDQSQEHQKQASSTSHVSQQERSQVQSQSADDQTVSSEGAVAEGGSSSGASPLENDPNLATINGTPAPSSN